MLVDVTIIDYSWLFAHNIPWMLASISQALECILRNYIMTL